MNVQITVTREDAKALVSNGGGVKNPEGFYHLKNTSAEASVSEYTGDMVLRLATMPVNSDGDTFGPSVYHRLTLPMATPTELLEQLGFDPDLQELKGIINKANTRSRNFAARKLRSYLNATRPGTLPTYPQFDGDNTTWTLNGETITEEKANELREEINFQALQFFVAAFNDPTELEGDLYLARIHTREAKNGKTYRNVDVYTTLPEGAEVIEGIEE